MTVSADTIEEIVKVLRRHLSEGQVLSVVWDLQAVNGNQSFVNTMRILAARVGVPEREKKDA